ncbi:hypothetical protein PMAYCL1PPCAC_28675, partial [Pristionchus mayeri]
SAMMTPLRGLILALLSIIALSKKYSVYRISPLTIESLQFLEGLTKDTEIDFWKEPRAVGMEVHAMITDQKSASLLDQLRSRNISFSVMIDDVEKVIKNQKKRAQLKRQKSLNDLSDSKVNFNLAEYHSYDDVISYFDDLALTYPHLVSIHPIGETHEGRQIPLIKITNKNITSQKRSIWIDGGIHAREWISPATVLYFIHQLTNEYEQDPIIREYVDSIEWNLVPLLNRDGYEYSRTSTDLDVRKWRKNRSPCKEGTKMNETTHSMEKACCHGVDLNRNFGWCFGKSGSHSDSCSDLYSGESAFCEPESRAVRDFISQHPMTTYVSLHSYSQMLFYPFAHKVR